MDDQEEMSEPRVALRAYRRDNARMFRCTTYWSPVIAATFVAGLVGCNRSSGDDRSWMTTDGATPGGGGAGTSTGQGPGEGSGEGSGEGTDTVGIRLDVSSPGGPGPGDGEFPEDPKTCAEAELFHTYVGCEFWPTVTYNPVLTNFDFAAVVANGGDSDAEIEVSRDGQLVVELTVGAGEVGEIHLPWVGALKGPQFGANTKGARPNESVRVDGGAFRLTSSIPVTAWQFNPLQYTDEISNCSLVQNIGLGSTCLSVSNDASLLIPSSAMTPNYRVFLGASTKGIFGGDDDTPASFAVTAVEDATTVTVQLTELAEVIAGPGIEAIEAGGVAEFLLDAGDVIQLMGTPGQFWGDANSDLSGSLVTANHPIQVIGVVALTSVPSPQLPGEGYADHLEETILPVEVLGDHYVVAPPSSSQGENIGHYVRIFGNFDDTVLDYSGVKPAGAPETLESGEVVSFETNKGFEVSANSSFAIGMFVKGGLVHTPAEVPTVGDPAFSLAVAVPQFRDHYLFLAPKDYMASFVDIVMPEGADVTLDGSALQGSPEPIEGTSWVVVRERLGSNGDGIHRLAAMGASGGPVGVGIQVMGYGHATGYMYPGGLNLQLISDIPAVP